jgi:zinc/manganese transport system substrate-binding protein
MSTTFREEVPLLLNQEGFRVMKTVIGLVLAVGLILTSAPTTRAADGKVSVVAAENFYGDAARQIGGDDVAVASIMSNPDKNPHLFETTPSVVKQIAGAQIVILNGADYDPCSATVRQICAIPLSVVVGLDTFIFSTHWLL